MLLSHLKETRETPEIPLWASIIMNGLAKPAATRPIFYLTHDGWQIVAVGPRRDPGGSFFIIVKCEGLGVNANKTHVKSVWPSEFDHITLKKYKDGHRLAYRLDSWATTESAESDANEVPLKEDVDEPLFVSMARKLLAAGKPVYFSGGGFRVTKLVHAPATPRFPNESYVFWLEHTIRKEHGQPKKSSYTIWEEFFDNWELKRFKDGHTVRMRRGDAGQVAESAESDAYEYPLWSSLAKKLLASNKPLYFAGGGNRITDMTFKHAAGGIHSGVPTITLKLEHVKKKTRNGPQTQTYTIWEHTFDEWHLEKYKDGHALRMRQSDPPRIAEEVEEPLIIGLMNRRLNRQGAIKVDIMHNDHPLKGWITQPFVASDSIGSKIYTTKVTGRPKGLSSRKYLALMSHELDYLFTLKTERDGNNNVVVKLVNK